MAAPGNEVADCFRANLRRCRRRAGLSQDELARLAAVHRTEVGLLENGARLPRLDTLVKLACVLEVSADELDDGVEWVPVHDQRNGSHWTRKPSGGEGR
jgi:transcriptional regulator with XRE-family HTH domain